MAEPVYGRGRKDDEEERSPDSEGRGHRQVREDEVKRGLSSVQVPVSVVKRGLSSVQDPVSDEKRGLSSVQAPFGDVKRGPSSVQVPVGDVKRSLSLVQVPMSDEGDVARLLLLRQVLLPLHPLCPRAPHLLLLHSVGTGFRVLISFQTRMQRFYW